ncbi:MAG TPA: cyanophycinase [Terracidiphilus sp.]
MRILVLGFLSLGIVLPGPSQSALYRYGRVGNAANFQASPRPGFDLMGGGKDLDEAFRFLCDRAGGGDFLILRATGSDDYNSYVQKLCRLNSVATLVIPRRAAAADPFVAQTIRHASALFISGGDQANYINFWMNTPVQSALNEAIRRGVPIGGTSAGLAVLGEYAYSAQGDKPDAPNLDSKTAIEHPWSPRITLVRGFLDIPILKGIVTDSHFAKRDRMGRLLVFLARLKEPDGKAIPPPELKIRGIGVDEGAALLLEPDGIAKVIGHGGAWFIDQAGDAGFTEADKPIEMRGFTVRKVVPTHTFNLNTWAGDALSYKLSVEDGVIHSTQPAHAIY